MVDLASAFLGGQGEGEQCKDRIAKGLGWLPWIPWIQNAGDFCWEQQKNW
jgi:hypothetical protein